MATHCSILAWGIPWTEEPGSLQSMGLQKSDTTEAKCLLWHCKQQHKYYKYFVKGIYWTQQKDKVLVVWVVSECFRKD